MPEVDWSCRNRAKWFKTVKHMLWSTCRFRGILVLYGGIPAVGPVVGDSQLAGESEGGGRRCPGGRSWSESASEVGCRNTEVTVANRSGSSAGRFRALLLMLLELSRWCHREMPMMALLPLGHAIGKCRWCFPEPVQSGSPGLDRFNFKYLFFSLFFFCKINK